MDRQAEFEKFKAKCAEEGFLAETTNDAGDDLTTGINDDGALWRFFRAREHNAEHAMTQYRETRQWRDKNHLIELYEAIDVTHFDETRRMYTHWIGRRDKNGLPICLFEIGKLTTDVMAAYEKSCATSTLKTDQTEAESFPRLFCTYESLIRFVFPLCSAVQTRPEPERPITATTCIIDITGVSLMQFWRLKNHMQAASTLATAHYPETLGRTYIIGAPRFFSTIWAWIQGWFHKNTVDKIRIVAHGDEVKVLSELIDPASIPKKYGGDFEFDFGMMPKLDEEIQVVVNWGSKEKVLPQGPWRWTNSNDGKKVAILIGTENGQQRREDIFSIDS